MRMTIPSNLFCSRSLAPCGFHSKSRRPISTLAESAGRISRIDNRVTEARLVLGVGLLQ
jgi:hypothetical protein